VLRVTGLTDIQIAGGFLVVLDPIFRFEELQLIVDFEELNRSRIAFRDEDRTRLTARKWPNIAI
jgi:hypothetical protein